MVKLFHSRQLPYLASVERGRKSTHTTLCSAVSDWTAISPMRRFLLLPPELIESPPSFLPFFLHLRSLLTPKVVCNSPSSHIMSTMPAGGRGTKGERVLVVRPVMTFGWFDKKCFEDSQLRKQERHRRAADSADGLSDRSPNSAGYFSTKVTTFQSPAPRL